MQIDGFIDKDEFKKQIDDWIQVFRNTKPAPGTNGPLIPGDPEREAEAIRSKDGIPLLKPVVDDLLEIARKTGIPFKLTSLSGPNTRNRFQLIATGSRNKLAAIGGTMKDSISISLPGVLKRKLDKLTKQDQVNRSDIVREALREYFTRREFQLLRSSLVVEAEKRGLYTDEDIFRQVS